MLSECVVCKQQASCIEVKSTCSNKILNYCTACLSNGYECYEELVQYGFTYECFNNTFIQKVVKPTLRYYNKTKEQFDNDVEQLLNRGNDNDT